MDNSILEKINNGGNDLQFIFRDAVVNFIEKHNVTSYPECVFLISWFWVDFADRTKTEIVPQYQIGRYRVDFFIPKLQTVIEIDSLAFHDRTTEQVEYERLREREIEALGFKVIRYAATEIIRDAYVHVYDLIESARKS